MGRYERIICEVLRKCNDKPEFFVADFGFFRNMVF